MTLAVDQIYSTLKTNFENMQVGVFNGYLTPESIQQVMQVLYEHFTYDEPKKFFIAFGVADDDSFKKKQQEKRKKLTIKQEKVDNYEVLTSLYQQREELVKSGRDTTEIDKLIDKEWSA